MIFFFIQNLLLLQEVFLCHIFCWKCITLGANTKESPAIAGGFLCEDELNPHTQKECAKQVFLP
ncbi:hypothetical protein JCM19046_3365 [Bacillus sp. JCM 19046]|nr:hypothetical protein JCM19046_3365 [Bacillus sp. JCM 19046]